MKFKKKREIVLGKRRLAKRGKYFYKPTNDSIQLTPLSLVGIDLNKTPVLEIKCFMDKEIGSGRHRQTVRFVQFVGQENDKHWFVLGQFTKVPKPN